VAAAQHRQAVSVNKKQASYTKEDLDIGDVCTIKVKGNTRAATDFCRLPVMVTKVIMNSADNKRYHVCSKDGHLAKSLYRNELMYLGDFTKSMLGIDASKKGFRKKLTVIEASALNNIQGGASCCQCKGNCAMNTRCTCKKFGQLCTSKCHKGHGSNNLCCNMLPEEVHEQCT